jgi:cold shock CspA family protein/ribosome-associated translation inhibitor RaiA
MDIPLELSFHNMAPSDSLKAAVRRQVDRLERYYGHIIGCRVVIEMPHKSHRLGSNTPDVHVLLRVPGREIVVTRELARAGDRKSATNAYAVLKDAFQAVQQRLKDYRRQQQGEVKPKDAPLLGHVVELVAERKYGFLVTEDKEELYFHRNAVADNGFDLLQVGDTVEYAPALGDKGQAAARVWRSHARNREDVMAQENLARSQAAL